jgi:hypothetical protein
LVLFSAKIDISHHTSAEALLLLSRAFWLTFLTDDRTRGSTGLCQIIFPMTVALTEIIVSYIEDALDIDDLENLGDYVRSVIVAESLNEWQLSDALRQLHAELLQKSETVKNHSSRLRLRAALSHFEADFADYLISKETGSLPFRYD